MNQIDADRFDELAETYSTQADHCRRESVRLAIGRASSLREIGMVRNPGAIELHQNRSGVSVLTRMSHHISS